MCGADHQKDCCGAENDHQEDNCSVVDDHEDGGADGNDDSLRVLQLDPAPFQPRVTKIKSTMIMMIMTAPPASSLTPCQPGHMKIMSVMIILVMIMMMINTVMMTMTMILKRSCTE